MAWWPWHLTFDRKSGVRVICEVGYLCANFGIPGPLLSSQFRRAWCTWYTDMRQTDRQTDIRQHHRLMSPPIGVGDIITCTVWNVRNIIAIILLQKNQRTHRKISNKCIHNNDRKTFPAWNLKSLNMWTKVVQIFKSKRTFRCTALLLRTPISLTYPYQQAATQSAR